MSAVHTCEFKGSHVVSIWAPIGYGLSYRQAMDDKYTANKTDMSEIGVSRAERRAYNPWINYAPIIYEKLRTTTPSGEK